MNLRVIQHIGIEGPGVIADWARERGFSLGTTHLYRNEPLPQVAEVDFLVLMGGPMNVYQDRDYPWLRSERAWLREYLAMGKPAVGICLGSQLLADALGGRVTQNPMVEIGWFPVYFSADARERFPFLPASYNVIHWHGDTFELPAGALLLGSSEGCGNQGFLFDDRVLGLQFHPEMTSDGLSGLIEAEGQGTEMLAQPEEAYATPQALLRLMLDRLKF